MFNRWRKFNPLQAKSTGPKKRGWYSCTVEVKGQQRYVMMLYWHNTYSKFIDNLRQSIFNYYFVYYEEPISYYQRHGKESPERMLTNELCDRTKDVICWKKIPRAYMKGFKKDKLIINNSK